GMVGGTIVALISGSSLAVSGPAAGLTVIVASAITQLGSFESFLLAVALAGVIQLILGFLRAGIIGYYFPSSVIKGMLAAIGLILIFKQIPHALGYDKAAVGDINFIQLDGENTFTEIVNSVNHLSLGAIIISLISLFILILWDRPFLRKYNFFRLVPGALLVVILGTLINEWFKLQFPEYALAGEHLVVLPVADSAKDFAHQFTLPDFSQLMNVNVYVVAFTIAIVASLETLLSIEATDKLDPYKRNTPTNRELKAQGLGNLISGLIGGLPMTAVIVRSSANINAGAKTKLAALIHGILLLLSVLVFANFLNKIPLACLAAVLLMVGYKLAKISLFKSMFRLGWDQFLPFIITILAILFTDLLKGISVGMAVSIFFILRNNYRRPYEYDKVEHHEGETVTLSLSEDITFLNKGSIALMLDSIPEDSTVIIDGSKTHYIDLDVLEIIENFKESSKLKNIKVVLKDIPEFEGAPAH
ncbi:MAG TPA: SulP family inorganic anion transporter, partial [Bacteroidia bacterium]|nr:SulP family inorganic anion transporter [Bacteroidia bacterium]